MVDYTASNHHLCDDSAYQKFQGKAVIIMGDSAGIGRATTGLMAEYGARVFFAARNPAELNRALASVEQEGGQWDGIVMNILRVEDARSLLNLAWQRMGKIDLLIIPPADRDDEGLQNSFMHEAIQHINSEARITTIEMQRSKSIIDQASDHTIRRDDGTPGIKVTVIEPGLSGYRHFKAAGSANHSALISKDVAQTIFDCLLLRFGPDLGFKNG
jgi:hypothetical protein